MASGLDTTRGETATRIDLGEFLARLDALDGYPTEETLRDLFGALDLSFEDVADVARFSEDRYQRNLLREGSHYHALVLCWGSGQRSPIHDHVGSLCGVYVVRGVATETVFEHSASGGFRVVSMTDHGEGSVMVSFDTDVHQVSNLQAGRELVTLHVYAPPLLHMNQYSLDDGSARRFDDPIVGHVDGSGI